MKKMSTKQKLFNNKKANAGHDRQAKRAKIRARLRHQAANYVYKPMQFAPAGDPTIADVPQTELADTDTVKL